MRYVALITGASSGIGEATARRLAREEDVHLVLVARRRERLEQLASQLAASSLVIPADLTDADAPAMIAAAVERELGELHLLVNNAGSSWRGAFADKGWANVERHMRINFDAQLRLIESLLPLLRRTAATARAAGSSSADALCAEERPHGVHVGLVLPGFIVTEGFPQRELVEHPLARLIVSSAENVAEAILDAGPGGKAERYVPRYYWIAAAARILAPAAVRRALGSGALYTSTPATDRTDD